MVENIIGCWSSSEISNMRIRVISDHDNDVIFK